MPKNNPQVIKYALEPPEPTYYKSFIENARTVNKQGGHPEMKNAKNNPRLIKYALEPPEPTYYKSFIENDQGGIKIVRGGDL